MKNNFVKNVLKNAAVIATKNSGTIYQPKAPALLKKFSKIEK